MPGACYRRRGFYAAGLSRWLEHYPRERLLILFYEDWQERPGEVLEQTWSFLGVEPPPQSIVTRENVTSLAPRWLWLHRYMTENNAVRAWAQRFLPLAVRDAITAPLRLANLKQAPKLDPSVRRRLAQVYHDDLDRLEALTGRDLSAWRS